MKILFRTLAILAAALLVVAGLYAFAQSPAGTALRSTGERHGGAPGAGFEARSFEGASGAAGRPEGFESREGHGHGHGPSLFGLVEVAKNFAIVAVSVALIALGARAVQLGRRDRPNQPDRAPPDQPVSL
jgi:hypothetical protein